MRGTMRVLQRKKMRLGNDKLTNPTSLEKTILEMETQKLDTQLKLQSETVSHTLNLSDGGIFNNNLNGCTDLSKQPILFVNSPPAVIQECTETSAQATTFSKETNNGTSGTTVFTILNHPLSSSTQSSSTITMDSDFTILSDSVVAEFSKQINLRQIFATDVIGEALIQKSKCKLLTNTDRDKISDIVVTHCINKFKKLDHEQFDIMAEGLVKIFPSEKKSTFFIAPIKKCLSKRHKSERARGKLVEKYRNKIHLLKTLTTEINTEPKETTNTLDISIEAKDSHIWMKNNSVSTPADILEHWRRSYSARKFIGDVTIQKYLEDWPVLKTQLAYELISYDFEQIHKCSNLDIQEKFDHLFEKIFRSKNGHLNATDSSIATLLESEITTDSQNALKLYLLPSLLPSKGRTRLSNKKQWKPSILETRDALFIHAKTPGEIEEIQKKRVDTMFQKGLTVQPYIILIGPSLGNITSALFIINSIQYKSNTVIEAIDFCFKAYQVLDAKYPFEVEHLWYLIQWIIYNYETKNDIKCPFLNEFL